MAKQRISYVDPATVTDPKMLAEFDRCRREGTPRPESQAIRAHVPAAFWSFAAAWDGVFRNGVMDHPIKELCRVYVSHADFEKSGRYDERQKAACKSDPAYWAKQSAGSKKGRAAAE